MPRGYDRTLYVLPFDHRGSFQTRLFGWKPPLNEAQTAEIAGAKQVIYDGFRSALGAGVPKEKAGILVDEQFGAAILRDAAASGVVTACPAEKSGQGEFDFEYGEDFARPSGGASARDHGSSCRPGTVDELQDAGVDPDVWKVEGLDRREDCQSIVAAAREGGRDQVRHWLGTAAGVPGFIGFAVGRTDFWDPPVAWRTGKATREQAVAEIAHRYREFVDLFEKATYVRRAARLWARPDTGKESAVA
jgi:myo-inositol catabolism protein IolC